jgi:hypothetical protein
MPRSRETILAEINSNLSVLNNYQIKRRRHENQMAQLGGWTARGEYPVITMYREGEISHRFAF